jgi:hypothetical protein
MNIESTIVLFAVVAALGLVTVVAVNIMLTAQEAEAKCRVLIGLSDSEI